MRAYISYVEVSYLLYSSAPSDVMFFWANFVQTFGITSKLPRRVLRLNICEFLIKDRFVWMLRFIIFLIKMHG